MIQTKHSLISKNNYRLSFTLFKPDEGNSNGITALIASAMAVPQHYYKSFAEYLIFKGYNVITFDYLS